MITNWAVSASDQALITQIAWRAHELAKRLGLRGREAYHVRDASMDVTAVHNNSCQLALANLLAASDADFAHDVFGIRRHLNRDNGTLYGAFRPRYAA